MLNLDIPCNCITVGERIRLKLMTLCWFKPEVFFLTGVDISALKGSVFLICSSADERTSTWGLDLSKATLERLLDFILKIFVLLP